MHGDIKWDGSYGSMLSNDHQERLYETKVLKGDERELLQDTIELQSYKISTTTARWLRRDGGIRNWYLVRVHLRRFSFGFWLLRFAWALGFDLFFFLFPHLLLDGLPSICYTLHCFLLSVFDLASSASASAIRNTESGMMSKELDRYPVHTVHRAW